MAQIFSLGGITFDQTLFEVPQDLEWGSETWGSIHNIPQTDNAPPRRIAQIFGVFPKTIKWEAWFLGVNAEDKLSQLKAIQAAQTAVSLVIGQRSWDVVVWDVTLKNHSRYELGFSVEVRPLAEKHGTIATGTSSAGAGQMLRIQQQQIQTLVTAQAAATSQQVATAGSTQAMILSAQTISAALADARTAAVVAMSNIALLAIAASQPEQFQTITGLIGLASTVAATIASVQALQASVYGSTVNQDTVVYSWSNALLGALTGYSGTLAQLTGSDKTQTVPTLPGQDCFTFAATHLGDWTRFSDLMTLNGLTDPVIPAATPLIIPRT